MRVVCHVNVLVMVECYFGMILVWFGIVLGELCALTERKLC